MTEQLKPCPFCGAEAYIEQPGTRRQSCIVECGSCGLRHDSGDEGDRCGTSWNRRALESRVLAERKEEPVAQIIRRKTYSGLDVWDIKIFDKDMQHGTKLFTHPLPDDAKDAARYRWLKDQKDEFDKMAGASCYGTKLSNRLWQEEDWDAAIDRARQSGEEGK